MANELSERERTLRRLPLPVSEAELAAVFPPVRMLARARRSTNARSPTTSTSYPRRLGLFAHMLPDYRRRRTLRPER